MVSATGWEYCGSRARSESLKRASESIIIDDRMKESLVEFVSKLVVTLKRSQMERAELTGSLEASFGRTPRSQWQR
jgi:hypothetical protein